MSSQLQQSLPALGRTFRRFKPHLARERRLVISSLACLVLGAGLRLLEPFPIKLVFDRVFPTRRSPRYLTGLAWLEDQSPQSILLYAAVALVVVVTVRALADYANRVGFAKIGNRVLTRVRNELFRHMQALPLSFHTAARTGDLTVRVISDVNMLRDVMVTAVLPLAANTLILLGMWGVMFAMSWRLALLGLATLPLLALSTTLLSRRIRDAARRQRRKEGAMASTAAEAIGAVRVVQAFGLESTFASTFDSRSEQSQKQDVRAARLTARLERTVDVLVAVATALVIWYGARLVIWGELTPGDLVIFLTYLRRAFNPMQDFAKYTGRLAKAGAAGERVLDLLDRAPEIRDRPGARPAPPLRGHITFDAVIFAYDVHAADEPGATPTLDRPLGAKVLDDLTLEIPAGARAAVVGPSGIGKSTLASLLLRLYEPQAGRVLIDGHDTRDFTLASLRAQVAVVLQESLLFAASIRENIAYGRDGATDPEIEAAARLACAHEFVAALPLGYDTVLGERGVTLSGGQRQRVAIARAAVRNAPILLLDEPTTGLDEENQRTVIDALERVARGRTTVFITHDLVLASRTDVIFYLDAGKVAEAGSHDDLLARDGRYAALYRLQTLGAVAGAPGSPAAAAGPAAVVPPAARAAPD